MVTNTHGGRRAGAGRKPSLVEHPVRQTVYLDQRHMHQIGNYQSQHGGTFSAALRGLLDSVKEQES